MEAIQNKKILSKGISIMKIELNFDKIDVKTIDELIRHMRKENALFMALGSLEYVSKRIKSGSS